jgi:endonuclease/exonuclease/phosphatase family metal-dependent hydrolase
MRKGLGITAAHWRLVLTLFAGALLASGSAAGQEVGDTVVMRSTNPKGVPVHPADGDTNYVRWPNGSTGEVREIGRWFRVETPSHDEGWITDTYLTVVLDEDEEPTDGEEEPTDGAEAPFRVVGSWNLEHFKENASRGFPEDTLGNPGPTYPQEERDLSRIAGVIRDNLGAAVLALSEINGVSNSSPPRSEEMDLLVAELGTGWEYVISSDGESQRVALLNDSSKARRQSCHAFRNASGPRDHLGCLYTLLAADGSAKNDLVVIGVHLKSGQGNNSLHNAEMAGLAGGFGAAFDGNPFSATERDIVIAGDFNANFYDDDEENFWTDFAGPLDIDVLAPELAVDYPPTRLRNVPLRPGSIIDYVMGSAGVAEDLVQGTAHVHHELLISPFEEFRRRLSDHIPVTVRVKLETDDD